MEYTPKMMKTCDQCKARKVRCVGAAPDGPTSCNNCVRRNVECHFSSLRKPRKRKSPIDDDATPMASSVDFDLSVQRAGHAGMAQYDGLQELYVDRLLSGPSQTSLRAAQKVVPLQGLGVFGNEYSLTFFSEARLTSLRHQLGHDRVCGIRDRVTAIITERMKTHERPPQHPVDTDTQINCGRDFGSNPVFVSACVKSFFEHVHPFYPFLDRLEIESIALSPLLDAKLATDKSWSALIHAVLALGSQYHDGGSFVPGKKQAWYFFSTALALFPDLLITKPTLVTVQAITAMAIFASNVSCMQFEYAMVSEAATKAQTLGYNRSPAQGHDPRNRVFWVLYCLEKGMTFTIGRSSTITDADISSAVTLIPLAQPELEQFDLSYALIRLSRLLSRIYSSLYSVSVRGRPLDYFKATVSRLKEELVVWRDTIPAILRPNHPIRPHVISTPLMMNVCVRIHYMYHSTMLNLNRAALQLRTSSTSDHDDQNPAEIIAHLMHTAQTILELTKYVEVEPYTSLWVLVAVPISALLLLFDLVIDNPAHPETNTNLALLDVGSGHFSRLEYASQGALPGSIIAEFAHLARNYVQERRSNGAETSIVAPQQLRSFAEPVMQSSGTTSQTLPMLQMPVPTISMPGNPGVDGWNGEWDFYPASEEFIPGTEMMHLFGSHFIGWDKDWMH